MDPAVYNAIKAEDAKLEAEKDGLKMQKEELEDEVDMLQSEKDTLTIEIETLNREKKQAETAVKGLQTMCSNLASRKAQLTSDLDDLQNQLSAGKISLMQQRPSRLRDMCQQRGRDMAFDLLSPS